MEWINELIQRAAIDHQYQQMLEIVKGKEAKFLNVRNSLSPEQRDIIDDYIAACEELDHILTGIAYTLGKEKEANVIFLHWK